ncbi:MULTISPECIES: DUF6214 family protein [unclassified Streptomyces]|uniref:DUF6214 family protein n=1 Tax=unclassified Streptomyces TaxID=2593676 RepID=UPI0008518767|nr:DUF6214 family protein [Streptomyces sp. LUP47B]MBW8820441.1 hypothetical protein [Streptomyces sp.]
MSVWPAWEVREDGGTMTWFHVRLAFADGARVDTLVVVAGGGVSLEDVRAQPALSLEDLGDLADWIEGPLFEACGVTPSGAAERLVSHARPAWPCGMEGRWLIAQEYRAAQEGGVDPVLAVMCATGHSRRKSLRLISQARDAGFLTPRHARR